MKITNKLVERFLEIGLNPVPVRLGTKEPIRKAHQTALPKEDIFKYDFEEIGFSSGYSSGSLEVLDFDLKNTNDPDKFMKEYNSMIPSQLFDKLVIQSTPSGGYHFIYRCIEIQSNQKLARAKDGAAIIETRGLNGYIKCYPSEGYKMIQGTFADIEYISPEERNLLFILAKQKDELLIRDVKKRYSDEDLDYLKKFPTYNEDSQIGIDLLLKAGWTFHSENGPWYNMTRPNSESGDIHSGYNLEGKFFQVFSTAQETFDTNRGYNNHAIFAELECESNYKKAYALLYEQGHGVDNDDSEQDEPVTFVSSYEYENEYLDQIRKDEIPLGLTTGWSSLDEYYRLKKNSFDIFLGLEGIGKSIFLSSLMVASKVVHGFKWIISSPEAQVYTTRRDLIEAETGSKLNDLRNDVHTYKRLLKDSREHFFIINNEKHFKIDEILERAKILYQKHKVDALLIDPFSFYAGTGNFTDDTEVLSKMRVFSQNYCSIIVVDHPGSGFARNARDEDGFLTMPNKYDIIGGNSRVNRCDNFVCFHRINNHPNHVIRKTMQISVQKIKDLSTGGKIHEYGTWSSLIYEKKNGFLGFWDEQDNNPMYNHTTSRKQVKTMSPQEAFGDDTIEDKLKLPFLIKTK